MPRADLIVYNIGRLLTFSDTPLGRVNWNRAVILSDAGVAVRDGVIVEVGSSAWIRSRYDARDAIDASGRLVTPGLIDIHTHPLFYGSRADELEMKLLGYSYGEILARGGGIYRTVEATRRASDRELLDRLLSTFDVMLEGGTTTVEVKTGYGLDPGEEWRHLRLLGEAASRTRIGLVRTLLAHVPPRDGDRGVYVEEMARLASRAGAEGAAEYIDVFCDKGAFTVEESRAILLAGLRAGLRARLHADQLSYIGCSLLAGELSIDSVEHLENMPPSNAGVLARAGSVAGLLPTSIMAMMQKERPPVDALRSAGVPIALGSDYNANNMTPLVQTSVQVAPYILGLTQLEALAGATYVAARSLGLGDRGRIRPGMRGDLALWSVEDPREIGYVWGLNLVEAVVVGGVVVKRRVGC
ncbi:MAG: imidazolonepropionase [Desulfurococcales archaeon]|nr:imidazolonepropionase [Desulfurococcales archaeon]